MMEAKSQYQIVVDEYIKRGRARDAGDVLKKMADIDPSDLKIRSKLADLYAARRKHRQGGRRARRHRRRAHQEGPPERGAAGSREGAQDRSGQTTSCAASWRGSISSRRTSRRPRSTSRRSSSESPNDTAAAVSPGRGLPRREAHRGGGGDLQAASGARPAGRTRAACRWAACSCPRDSSTRLRAVSLPVVDKLIERKEGDKAAALLQQIIQKNAQPRPGPCQARGGLSHPPQGLAVAPTYSQLTEAYINQGQFEQAAGVLESCSSPWTPERSNTGPSSSS